MMAPIRIAPTSMHADRWITARTSMMAFPVCRRFFFSISEAVEVKVVGFKLVFYIHEAIYNI